MTKTTIGTAPAKAILFGEHAVVYGHPAIAVPLTTLRAKVTITNAPGQSGVRIDAVDLKLQSALNDLAPAHPIRKAIDLFCQQTNIHLPALIIQLHSDIPIASGLGSGAAITVALIRALSNYFETQLSNTVISNLTYEVEKLHHGTPSGIDNTVITYEQPVWFIREKEITPLQANASLHFLIANSGLSTLTIETVSDVRKQLMEKPQRTKQLLEKIGNITHEARTAIQTGDLTSIGKAMIANHECLKALEVSCSKLDDMVAVALLAGAFGAKLSGGGRGGNMIALVDPSRKEKVIQALQQIGITEIYSTTLVS